MKIGIIIDNPIRDLPGILLLTRNLLKYNNEVYLIPMYFQGFDIEFLNIDILILNYVRSNNYNLIKKYKSFGIQIYVLDTEGGVISDHGADSLENWPKLLIKDKANKLIDGYFFWGPLLSKSFTNTKCIDNSINYITGNPRFDFLNKKYNYYFKNTDKYILINTNFSSIIPLYSNNRIKEYDAFKIAGWSDDYINLLFKENENAFNCFLSVIKDLLVKFPEKKFKIRPHPFESLIFYQNIFKKYANCVIVQNENIFQAIHNANCVIHLNCGTSVESIMLNKLPIQLEFLNNEFLKTHTPLPAKISYNAKSIEDLHQVLINIEEYSCNFDFVTSYNEYIYPFFYKNDGNSSERVSKILNSVIYKNKIKYKYTPRNILKILIGSFLFFYFKSLFNINLRNKWLSKNIVANEFNRIIDDNVHINVEYFKLNKFTLPFTTLKCKLNKQL